MLPLNTDMRLIHAILQEGVKGYYRARAKGVRTETLYEETRPVWDLIARLAPKGRTPSVTEIRSLTGVQIDSIHPDPLDVDIHAELIVKRGLTGQIHQQIEEITGGDAINKDPFGVRDKLTELPQKIAWSYGEPFSLNNRDSLDELVSVYNRAASRGGRLLGLSSPWPIINEASLGLQPGELTVLFAKRKVGKTVCGQTLTHDPITGRERTLEELVKEPKGGKVFSWEKNSRIHPKVPSAYMDCGHKECLRITFRSGRSIVAAKTHPFRAASAWVRADELVVGHHVAGAAVIPEPLKPVLQSPSEIKILAYMIADGGCSQTTPSYTKSPKFVELIDDLRQSLQTIGGDLSRRSHPSQFGCVGDGSGHGNPVVALLRTHRIMYKKSVQKIIPPAIFSLPNEQLALFLGRLFSGDGCVEKRKTLRMVSYSTGSKKMAEQLQHLLLRFGVITRIQIRPRDTGDGSQDYYELIFRKESIERFKERIGPHVIGPKKVELDQVEFQGKSRVGWIKNEELWDLIRAEMEERPELVKAVGDKLGYTSFRFQKSHVLDYKSGRIRRKIFEAFCEVYDSDLRWILDENIWWDQIISITPVGKKQCYDLSIPETECYVANDFIVHNSWLVITWAAHIWKTDLRPGEKLLFVTMEMTPLQILQRLACIMLKLSWSDFHGGKLTTAERKLLDQWIDRRKNASDSDSNIVIIGSDQVRTVNDLSAVVGEYSPKAVVADSFYIMGRASGRTLHERVLANVQELKLDIAVRHHVPVLASTQLKGTTDKDVLMADSDDAMGAKAIGDYADATIGLFMDPALKAANQRLLRGMEARQFLPRGIKMWFDLGRMNFAQIEEVKERKKNSSSKKKKRPKKPSASELAAEDDQKEDQADDLSI